MIQVKYCYIFVRRDTEGKVQTYIECSNRGKKYCNQLFNFINHMIIRVRLDYNNYLSPDWQKIEENTIQSLNSFQVK